MLRDMKIDCTECIAAGTSACDDCVVTFIVNREPGDASWSTPTKRAHCASSATTASSRDCATGPPGRMSCGWRLPVGFGELGEVGRAGCRGRMPRATMLTSQPSACARSAPTVQFSLPPSVVNGS